MLSLQRELVAVIHGAFEVAVEIAAREVKSLVGQATSDMYEELQRENESLKQRLRRAEALLVDSARSLEEDEPSLHISQPGGWKRREAAPPSCSQNTEPEAAVVEGEGVRGDPSGHRSSNSDPREEHDCRTEQQRADVKRPCDDDDDDAATENEEEKNVSSSEGVWQHLQSISGQILLGKNRCITIITTDEFGVSHYFEIGCNSMRFYTY